MPNFPRMKSSECPSNAFKRGNNFAKVRFCAKDHVRRLSKWHRQPSVASLTSLRDVIAQSREDAREPLLRQVALGSCLAREPLPGLRILIASSENLERNGALLVRYSAPNLSVPAFADDLNELVLAENISSMQGHGSKSSTASGHGSRDAYWPKATATT